MKIIVATDSSRHSDDAIGAVGRLPLRDGSKAKKDVTQSIEVVSVVETGADESLRELRDRCVDQRLQHEPEWALARIGAAEHAYAWEEVAGFETEQFEALDMQVDGRLRAILTPEQYETLPRRPWDREKKLESKDVDAKKAIERKNGLGNSRTKAAPGKGG